jgi:hypothetical protein
MQNRKEQFEDKPLENIADVMSGSQAGSEKDQMARAEFLLRQTKYHKGATDAAKETAAHSKKYNRYMLASVAILALSVFIEFTYSKIVTNAVISLVESDVKHKVDIISRDKFRINLFFKFKNVGKETANIKNIQIGHYEYTSDKFEVINKMPMLSQMHSESSFIYRPQLVGNISSELKDKLITDAMLPQLVGRHVIIIIIDFEGDSIFSLKKRTVDYYFEYAGDRLVLLTEDNYKKIKDKIPAYFWNKS